MKSAGKPVLSDEEQAVIDEVQLRLLDAGNAAERERFDELLRQEHYLKDAQLVGERLRYVAEHKGQWVALIAWSAGSFKLKLREAWIGWTSKQKERRLPLVANNSRFLILKEFHIPNLASRVMKLCLQRLSKDWEQRYNHKVLIAETFVDGDKFAGTCYKASGWTLLGKTQGYKRARKDFYQAHDRPKQLWVRELQEGARTVLRGRNLPDALGNVDRKKVPDCEQSARELQEMRGFFDGFTDWRKRFCPHRLSGMVVATICAMLCKVCLGQRDLAAFARNMTADQMEALGFPRDWDYPMQRRYKPPSESSFFRLLSHLDHREMEAALLRWQDHVLGKRDPKGDQVAVDGKELLNSQGMKIASAYSVTDGRWLGSEAVAEGSNEISAVQELLRRADIEGSLVTADAMNTQTQTARIVVQERGADYLFTVKGNQKGVCENVRKLYRGLSRDFSPSAQAAGRPDL